MLIANRYDEQTARALAEYFIDHNSDELTVAFVSTPAAYRDFVKTQNETRTVVSRLEWLRMLIFLSLINNLEKCTAKAVVSMITTH